MQPVAEGVDVKQRQGQQETVAVRDLPAAGQVHRVGREIVVRENRALAGSRGAGGVDQRRGRVAFERQGLREQSGCGAASAASPGSSASVTNSFGSASLRMCDISRSR